jgi:pterin-4a-carbinolamine dehydratase
MSQDIIFNPGEGEGETTPESPGDGKGGPVVHPVRGTSWGRTAPPSELTFEKTLESPAEAGAFLRAMDTAIHNQSAIPGAKPVEELFPTTYWVDGSAVKAILTPKGEGELTEVAYAAIARAARATTEFEDDPFEPMKPERTQVWKREPMKPERTQVRPDDVFKMQRVTGSDWARVSHRHALVAEYKYATHSEAVDAAANAMSRVSGEPSRLSAIVSGRTLSLRLTSSRSQQLTEIEFALADEIDDQLTAEAED